jgi:hypothetical protein
MTRRGLPTIERFMQYVVPEPNSGCWLWLGGHIGNGYGNFYLSGKRLLAHRVSYELHVGQIPGGLTLDHLCRVRSCVNPRHLEPVTFRENLMRGEGACAKHARKTHCPEGHKYDVITSRGHRACRLCQNAANRRAYARYHHV